MLPAVFAAGLLIGGASARHRVACIALLAAEPTLDIVIDERVSAGGRVTGEARGIGAHVSQCAVRAALRVRTGNAAAGAIVRARGTARATQRGLMMDADITASGRSETLRAWRGRTGETIDTLFRANAALVRALLIADQDGIDASVRDRFADAGLVHMLSISGLHVAIIAGALLTVASAVRLDRTAATAAALFVITLYVLMLGAPAPAVRSAAMLATMAASERLQRPVHPWTALALGAALPTVNPGVVIDLGYQLSVGGMAALVAARGLLRQVRQRDAMGDASRGATGASTLGRRLRRSVSNLRGWRWALIRECATGVVTTLVTAPLIAWTFGRVSLVASLSNIVAGPVVAFVQPALFLAIVLSPWTAGAQFVADATVAPLAFLDGIATVAASVPGASMRVAPTMVGACCAGVASAAFVRATASRRMLPGMVLAATALVAAVWAPLFTSGSGALELHMLDVGQGDAIALRTPGGRWVLVDAGRRWDGGDAGRRTVVPYVQRHGGQVAAFFMSHAHDDHTGGAASIAEALHPLVWWDPAFVTTSSGYRMTLAAVARERIVWRRAHPGDGFEIDGVRFRVLAPDSAWTAEQHDANETSVVLRVEYGNISFVLTGDAEAAEENWMVTHAAPDDLRADVLKVGHHGSRTSSTPEFLDAVAPRLALVSVGRDNRYGHPAPETLDAFASRDVPVLRTDQDGTTVVSTDGRSVVVATRGDRWTLAPR
ncbi:MAG TPA: DNA internalization-related competence protein ComEC/Rec2 [Gemmatimonas sp.]|nr:DNA internalization-related competence protein ComEC/Rec2 [Gemmatimonas sp.]